MQEIEKLRQRLTHVNPHVVEYRMTVTEAKELLKELDDLQAELNEKHKLPAPILVKEPELPHHVTMDGGGF